MGHSRAPLGRSEVPSAAIRSEEGTSAIDGVVQNREGGVGRGQLQGKAVVSDGDDATTKLAIGAVLLQDSLLPPLPVSFRAYLLRGFATR